MIVCLIEAVRTNPGYGMATLIYNNLLNLISGTVILLRSSSLLLLYLSGYLNFLDKIYFILFYLLFF